MHARTPRRRLKRTHRIASCRIVSHSTALMAWRAAALGHTLAVGLTSLGVGRPLGAAAAESARP